MKEMDNFPKIKGLATVTSNEGVKKATYFQEALWNYYDNIVDLKSFQKELRLKLGRLKSLPLSDKDIKEDISLEQFITDGQDVYECFNHYNKVFNSTLNDLKDLFNHLDSLI